MYYILHTLCLLNSNTKLKSWKKRKRKIPLPPFQYYLQSPSSPHSYPLLYEWAPLQQSVKVSLGLGASFPASFFFFLCDHRILTTHHVLREPPLSSFDYTALHRKGTQWVDVKWLEVADCQSMVMKQASCSSKAVWTFHWGFQETFHQSLNTKLLLKRLRYSGMGLDTVAWV